jgi:hypothetical protein
MFRYMGLLLLGTVLAAPVALRADEHDHDRDHDRDHRYYDQDRHDYHEWNEQEERAYRRWLEERHREYHDFARISRDQQREYWIWRHQHPDAVLWPPDRH